MKCNKNTEPRKYKEKVKGKVHPRTGHEGPNGESYVRIEHLHLNQ